MSMGGLRNLALAGAACGLVAAGGWATFTGGQALADRPGRAVPSIRPRPLLDVDRLAAPTVSPSAAGTFLGMPDEIVLDRLRRAPIRRVRINRGGSSLSLRLDFQDGSRAAFKPNQVWVHSNPRKEIAAYRINRELGLNRVPPAAARVITRAELLSRLDRRDQTELPRVMAEARFEADGRLPGEVSYWIPVLGDANLEEPGSRERWFRWLKVDGDLGADGAILAPQVSAMLVFDYLINNADRFSGANTLSDERLEHLYFMDNTMSFGPDPRGHPNVLSTLQGLERFSRRLIRAAGALDAEAIGRALAAEPDPPFPLLLKDEVEGVLARRDLLLRHVQRLVRVHGADRVLCFE